MPSFIFGKAGCTLAEGPVTMAIVGVPPQGQVTQAV